MTTESLTPSSNDHASPSSAEHRGLLVVLSGPSGVGKGTLIKCLLQDERFSLSVSATTRTPRDGERDGVDYEFIDEDEFIRRIEDDEFLEHAIVFGGKRYGTPRAEVERIVNEGGIALLDIDVQGARQLRERGELDDAISLFIVPPDMNELERRLRTRGTETEEAALERLRIARNEMRERTYYDHVVTNDELTRAGEEMRSICLEALARRQERGDGQ